MNYNLTDPYEIAKYIKDAKKTTPIKAYLHGDVDNCEFGNIDYFKSSDFYVLFGESNEISNFIEKNKNKIKKFRLEHDRRNSAIPMIDMTKINARIEPGAIIRDKAEIKDNAVIMMGAVINIGAVVGEESMIDMNAVLGARATVGKKCHIGAGTVIAGVLEPPSADPCIIEDNVVIGANAVILEGVRVGKNSVVAAGSVVTENVPEGVVVAGTPAKIIKTVDNKTKGKTEILDDLRK